MKKLWGGRFHKEGAPIAEVFQASLPFDRRFYREDIQGSLAHVHMLARQGIITQEEMRQIVGGLEEIKTELDQGDFVFDLQHEDIHMSIESRLAEKIGVVAGKLHTGRSRNDQVALDMRLFTCSKIVDVIAALRALQESLLDLAGRHRDVVMPGYTHLQRAQPVLFAHHLLAYFEMFQRDKDRFRDAFIRTDVLPLGSGALAGTTFPIDRASVAAELGFSQISRNSIDAVSDRDFILEFMAATSITMMHLSRFCEEIILWSSTEFRFITIDDSYATGSSIMPQKKNASVAELVRGKTGRVYGHLLGLLTVMKGLPLAYGQDMQEDKEAFFDLSDTLLGSLAVFTGMISTLIIHADQMEQAAGGGFSTATDLADHLVKKGLPFRQAHEVVGRLVGYCIEQHKNLEDLSREELQRFSPLLDEDARGTLSVAASVAARNIPGGTAPGQVHAALNAARQMLERAEHLPGVGVPFARAEVKQDENGPLPGKIAPNPGEET